MNEADSALLESLRWLAAAGYDFVTVTPETHRRVVAQRSVGVDVRDALGWSLPVPKPALPAPLFELLWSADALVAQGDLVRSRYRVSRVEEHLFLHSPFPTDGQDAVFLGPDTYRFVRFLKGQLGENAGVRHLADMGAGTGAGGICIARLLPGARISLVDTNPQALRLARINAAAAGLEMAFQTRLPDAFDLYIANPPFIQDKAGRAYRDGGGMHGAELSLDWALGAARLVEPGGRILLYTGSAIVDGVDALKAQLERRLPELGCCVRYEELDPDVFGEELETPAYHGVERIAAVGAVIVREA